MSNTSFTWHKKARLFVGRDAVEPSIQGPFSRLDPTVFSDEQCLLGVFEALKHGVTPAIAQEHPLIEPPSVPSFLCQSGGTTGQPKILQRTCTSWLGSFDLHQALFKISSKSRYAILGRVEHSLAMFAAIEGLCLGANVYLLGTFRPNKQAHLIHDLECDVIYATPTQIMRLVSFNALQRVKTILIGGGRLSPADWTALTETAQNADIRVFYGASETSFVTLSDAGTPETSVGKAYPNVEIQIRDANAVTEIGEIWVRSPYLFDRYALGQSQDTVWDGDWLSVGEMGHQDSEGYFYLSGRKGRMFTVADQNIFPEDVEAGLKDHPSITDAVVIPCQDAIRGNRIVAFVQSAPIHDLRSWCLAHMNPRAVPSEFRYISAEDWPRLPSGKSDIKAFQLLWETRQ